MRYHNGDTDFVRIILRNLILFLAGALTGCLLLRFWRLSGALSPSFFQESLVSGWKDVFLQSFRFLVLLFLLSYLPAGPLLVPISFGMEGALLGMSIGLISASMGFHGALALVLAILFRLILVFPFSFLLGSWAIRQGLRFGQSSREHGIKILFALFTVAAVSTVLELSISRQLGSFYYLTFGV